MECGGQGHWRTAWALDGGQSEACALQAGVFGRHGRVPLLAVDDESVRRARHLLLGLSRGRIEHELILRLMLRWRRGSIGEGDRAVVLDRGSHEVVGEKVDAQVDLTDLGLEVLAEVFTAEVSEVQRFEVQTNLRHGLLERLKVVAVEFASSNERDADDCVTRAGCVDELTTEAVVELLVGRVLGVRRRRSAFCCHFQLVCCVGE